MKYLLIFAFIISSAISETIKLSGITKDLHALDEDEAIRLLEDMDESGVINSKKAKAAQIKIKAMKKSLTTGHKSTDIGERPAQTSVGISGNFSKGEDEVKHSWMDVNGDGLPDKVYPGGQVALNLGYKFAPLE